VKRSLHWRGALRYGVAVAGLLATLLLSRPARAQEKPYFVTYSADMEEPGNLELESFNAVGNPRGGNAFIGSDIEFEYGMKTWWTTEFYLDGQATSNDSAIFTGFRWENRVRPWLGEHRVNLVLYAEFEDINGADKTLREIVGHDGAPDFLAPNYLARVEKQRELELKLILGSDVHGWNFSENFISEKNLEMGPWEFGYALGVSRPLQLAANAYECVFCREKWAAGVEMYGGLGTTDSFGTRLTSQYLGPTVNWSAPNGMTIGLSPQFGLNDYSVPVLVRFSVSYELQDVFRHFHK
jgi:hypothetical protein